MRNKNTALVVLGTLLLWPVSYASIIAKYPKIYSPYSLPVIAPVMLIFEISHAIPVRLAFAVGTLLVPILFVAWSYHLFTRQEQIPKRSKVVSIILTALSALMLVLGYSYGIQYQGLIHTIAICLFNIMFWMALFYLLRANARQPSFSTNFLFHWIMFAWLGWVAFPWLGELP